MAHGGSLRSLDPQAVFGAYEMRAMRQLYEPLLGLSADGTELVPLLAEAWEVADDNLTYTFTLREGVTFSDGTPFDANAVIATVERGKADPTLGFNFLFAPIAEVTSPDPFTVVLRRETPDAAFLKNLTLALILPPNVTEFSGQPFETPNGTGPFTLVAFQPNEYLELAARPDYWQAGLPKVENLTLRVIREEGARMAAAQAGEVDIAEGLGAQFIPEIEGAGNLSLLEAPVWRSEFIGFNTNREPFDDPRVRQAIAYAIDREVLVENIIQAGTPLASYPMPGLLGYNDQIPANPYDLEQARALLAEAGYPDGFSTNLLVAAGNVPKIEEMAQFFAGELQQLGIEVELNMLDSAGAGEVRAAGNYDMFIISTAVITGDPGRYFEERVVRDGYAQQGWGEKRPDVLDLIREASATFDETERDALYRRIQDEMWSDPPFVWFNQTAWIYAVNTRVQGFNPSPTTIFSLAEIAVQ
jgi:peptide/nickel transport system substrate-binding protein